MSRTSSVISTRCGDVHTNVDRWWGITNPTKRYSQVEFPNMDLAVTFHVGCACVSRAPRRPRSPTFPSNRLLRASGDASEASDALNHTQKVSDFQAGGVGFREALLAFTGAAQIVVPWTGEASAEPK